MNFVKMAATAERLVTKNGRTVTIIKFDTTAEDPSKPWKGPSDPRATPDASVTTKAAFVEPSSMVSLGMSTADSDLVKRSTKIMLVGPGATITDDLATFNEVIDFDGTRWKITAIETLRPAETVLLYYIGLAR